MGTPIFQRRTPARVKKVARDLHFVAFYHRGEGRLNSCMHDYAGRAFVYVPTSKYKGEEYMETNLISAREYGQLHGRSQEQVKVYLFQQDRISGIKIGRDWVILKDAKFPEDMREVAGRRN